MAKAQKDILNRLADVGEEAISRVAGSQTTSRLMESVGGLRERMDDLPLLMKIGLRSKNLHCSTCCNNLASAQI
jgi:hypothetical protein